MSTYLVYDPGGTFIKYALMNERYEILEQSKIQSPLEKPDDLFNAMVQIAEPYTGRYEGAAVSMPGRIDTDRGIAYAFIQNLNIADILSARLHCPIVVGNDGKYAAKAEAACGALKDTENGAVIVFGTGTGGGIIVRNEVTDAIRNGVDKLFCSDLPLPYSKPAIVTCKFRNNANLIGALSFYLDRN